MVGIQIYHEIFLLLSTSVPYDPPYSFISKAFHVDLLSKQSFLHSSVPTTSSALICSNERKSMVDQVWTGTGLAQASRIGGRSTLVTVSVQACVDITIAWSLARHA